MNYLRFGVTCSPDGGLQIMYAHKWAGLLLQANDQEFPLTHWDGNIPEDPWYRDLEIRDNIT